MTARPGGPGTAAPGGPEGVAAPTQGASKAATLLERRLLRRAPATDSDIALVLRVEAQAQPLATVLVEQGAARISREPPPALVDATFTFDRLETALDLLGGPADPIEMFMAGRFRADGNLPLAFVLLGLFRPEFGAPPP